jgi:hypothetical protein
MESPPYPRAAHVVGPPNCHALDNIEFAGNSQPKEPPLGDTGTERLLCPPSAVHLVESCRPQGRYNDDVESGSPRNEPTPNYTEIPHRQSAQALLNTLSFAKAIQTRVSQLFRLPAVAQTVQIRIRRLRKLPHVVRAIQAHIEQVSKIPQVARAMQASIERLSKISPLIRVTRRSSKVPTSTATASRPDLRSTWCCFICIAMSGRENVAMKIPCPPSKSGTADRETKIYEIINERLTIYYGMSRFLPFYGVQRVEEVNVRTTQSHMLDLCTDIYRSSNSSALPPIHTDPFRSSFVP